MPRRSEVAKLPQDVRRWLERSLEESGYGGYELLAELLKEKGFTISRSSLQRWGSDIERQRATIKAETDAAIALSEGSADDRDSRSEAMLALLQTGMIRGLRALMNSQDEADPAERVALLAKVGKESSSMARASMDLKRFQAGIEEAARRKLLEEQREKLDALGKSGAVNADVLAMVIKAAYDL
jgi:Protein of unknown function (DUF3486)